jgi:hypothetical protein
MAWLAGPTVRAEVLRPNWLRTRPAKTQLIERLTNGKPRNTSSLVLLFRLEEVRSSFTSCGAGEVAENATGCVQRLLRNHAYHSRGAVRAQGVR